MPVYNGEKYLSEAIDSILNQTFTDFEFLIINDGSTDDSVKIIQSYEDTRIRLIHNETNLKLIATLNKGIEVARGEYIARMDADDISLPDRLAKQFDFLNANSKVGVLGCAVKLIDHSGSQDQIMRFPSAHGFLRWSLFFYCPIAHPSVMMRRVLVSDAGGYRSTMLHVEDYDLWWRLSQKTRLSNLQEVLLLLRKHEYNTTKTHFDEHVQNTFRVIQLMMWEFLNKEVSIELVRCIWNGRCETSDDFYPLATLIYQLANASVNDNTLSAAEKQAICKDAVSRLSALINRRARYVNILAVLGLAFRLDFVLTCRIIMKLIRRKIFKN